RSAGGGGAGRVVRGVEALMLWNRATLLSAPALVLPPRAYAQPPTTPPAPPAPAPITVKETVQVVATRIPEAPNDVPGSIEVIGGATSRPLGPRNIRDALALAPRPDVARGAAGRPARAAPAV